jgi:hypothetical protein
MPKRTLQEWKDLLEKSESAYQDELDKMDERERMYRGEYTHAAMTTREDAHTGQAVTYVYNAAAETIEAQVSNDIPMPKVTARRQQDEHLAVIIENMIRNELDRLTMERVNDLSERVVPIQGGGLYLVEWDNTKRTHNTVGEVGISFEHPKLVIPQAGVFTGLDDMDYIFRKIPTTKDAVLARYGIDVSEEAESEPEIKGAGDAKTAEDMVTQYEVYYRNDRGGIGLYSWVNDTELVDLEDYQARRLRRCGTCGAPEPMEGEVISNGADEPEVWTSGGACPVCGGHEWRETEEDYEEVRGPIVHSDGTVVVGDGAAPDMAMAPDMGAGDNVLPPEGPAMMPAGPEGFPPDGAAGGYRPEGMALMPNGPEGFPPEQTGVIIPGGNPSGSVGMSTGIRAGAAVKVPYYKPDVYPLVLQRNVSVFGRLLGESDMDKMRPLQEGLNRMNQKLFDRFLKAGTKVTLPADATFTVDPEDSNVWRVADIADLSMIRELNFTGDVSQEMAEVQAIYQQMRQTIGVTDSFQGRRDTTATSGTAKQFAAAQAAGRLESKRVQKEAAYAELFERIFKFRLAYADEPRPVVYQDPTTGKTVYDQFVKWDFLEVDEAGNLYWNDQFLFGCDTTAPLASNRERLWQETTAFLQSGAFGDPADLETLVAYWRKMEILHYPGATETRKSIQDRLDAQRQAAAAQAAMTPPVAPGGPEGPQPGGNAPGPEAMAGGIPDEQIDALARQAALQDMGM